MGYKRTDLQILGGGFNLLPPGDKTPKTDYLLAQNWRVDRVGKLVSRFGYPQKFSTAGAGLAHSAAIHGGINGDYYVGCNNSLTAPTGSLYFNFGAVAIATGFDGNRIGMAVMNGWVWAMNRGKQGRHNASGAFQNWNLAAPGSSCVAAGAATPGVAASATYAYTLTGNTAYVHFLTIAGVTYQFAENGYGAGQLPLLISILAAADPNCSVTYSGAGANVVITPIIPNTLFALTGSDGNAAANVATGAISSLPNGTYRFYVTFAAADDSLESNPSPVSAAVTVVSSAITLTGVPVSADGRVGKRNIYATGGTLGQAYLVGAITDNASTSITLSTPDLEITNGGVVMPTDNDAPPAASGVVGPHFNRLFAFSTVGNTNRLFYTRPGLPQYWSTDPAIGDWVDVGMEGEAIVWCTIHANILVIYKERSIWMLVGDPATGYLQRVRDGLGLAGQFAIAEAGTQDYFVGPNGLYRFDMDRVHEMSGAIQPLFNASGTNGGSTSPPGSVKLGAAFNSTSTSAYGVALGYAMGKLYIGYAEQAVGTQYCLLVYHELNDRWFYHRTAITGVTGFFGFLFDGQEMVGLTGIAGGAAQGYNLDDFRGFFTQDSGGAAIGLVYQSHYEDAGFPDNQKMWLDLVIDYEFAGGDTATVWLGYDGGATALTPMGGSLTGAGRRQTAYPLGADGVLAKSISVAITASANNLLIIHNIYLYCYVEARLGNAASTIPIDLGSPKVKQCKELQLDIDASNGSVAVNVYSDLPGNQLAVRQTPTVATTTGRSVLKFPFPVTEGFLWRLALRGTGFRLYSARLLMRPIGTYVEAYEAAAGFVWDSMEQTFDSGITHIPRSYAVALASLPIKRAREISMQIDTFNAPITLTFLSDLPGDAMASRFTATINTGVAGRRFVRIPLPAGMSTPIEGRMFRVQLSGAAKFVLYEMAVELIAVGVYVEAYEAAGGAVYDSREMDFGMTNVKEARELELDIETTGAVTAGVLSDVSGSVTYVGIANTTGRQKVLVPLNVNQITEQFVEGRFLRLLLTGVNAFRFYGARLKVRPFGTYLTAAEGTAGALWDSTDLDLGSQKVKQFREIELDLWAYGTCVVTVYTDLPGNAMGSRVIKFVAATAGRTKVQIPLPQGQVPDNYLFGRLVRVTITCTVAAFKLFGARIFSRQIGTYVEAYEAAGGAVWDSDALDLGTQTVKQLRQLEFEIQAAGPFTVNVHTDQPGNALAWRLTSNQGGTNGRVKIQIPLPQGQVPDNYLFGRLARVVISSAAAFQLYGARIDARPIGVYLENYEAAGGAVWDSTPSDLGNPSDKTFDQVRFEMDTDGAANVDVYTDLPGEAFTKKGTFALTNGATGRHWATAPLPLGIEGRSVRLVVSSGAGFRIYSAQVRSGRVGRYLCAATPAGNDALTTLEFDFESERVKLFKKIEIDMRADGQVNLSVITNQTGALAAFFTPRLSTPNGRDTLSVVLPPGARGRLLRLAMTSTGAARIYHVRVWTRPVNEPEAKWAWVDYPIEPSDVLPAWQDLPVAATPPNFTWADLPVEGTAPNFGWQDLPVEPTKPEWVWAPFPVNPTEPQWFWAKILSVEETPDTWQFVDVPFEVME